jgi:hypothetical protein
MTQVGQAGATPTRHREDMRRIPLLAAALVLLAVAVAATAGSSLALTGPGTIRIKDRQVKHIHLDGGPHGRGAGDQDFYRQLLHNRGITIGHSDIMCTNTGTGSANCSGTYFLPKGKLMVAGVLASRLFYELPIIGGTRLYENACGTLTGIALGGSPRKELLTFRLSV